MTLYLYATSTEINYPTTFSTANKHSICLSHYGSSTNTNILCSAIRYAGKVKITSALGTNENLMFLISLGY